MNYNEFLKKTFPIQNPYKRRELGLFHNTIKFFALIFSYICYKSKISANLLDLIGFLLSILSILLICNKFIFSTINYKFLIIGYLLIGLVLFIDFVDGQLARLDKKKYVFGDNIDNFNPDLIQVFLIVYPGIVSQNFYLFLLSSVSGLTFKILYNQTHIIFKKKYPNLIEIYKFFLGFRFLYLILFPLLSLINYFEFKNSLIFFAFTTGVYFFGALTYYYKCAIITK